MRDTVLGDYLRQRKVWLKGLQTGSAVKVRYLGSEYSSTVYRANDKSVWCWVQTSSRRFSIRFSRKTGEQWGGGMDLHIPDTAGA